MKEDYIIMKLALIIFSFIIMILTTYNLIIFLYEVQHVKIRFLKWFCNYLRNRLSPRHVFNMKSEQEDLLSAHIEQTPE